MNIPDEAVQAAQATYMTFGIDDGMMREALTAAAPFLQWVKVDEPDSSFEEVIAAKDAEIRIYKARGDNHWDALRSIREMAREGDCERIIQWVNDAGSGYTETVEATVKSLMDKAATLEADNKRLREALVMSEAALGEQSE